MDATTSGPVQKTTPDNLVRPPRPRSKPYPAFTIEHCIKFTEKVDTAFSSVGFTPQESISKTLDQSGGGFLTLLSCCVQYGLLEKSTGTGYKPSELFKKINRPLPTEKVDDFKLECFSKPKLYKDLIEAYADKQVPAESGLANILDRLHGVVGDASVTAARVFYKNAKALKVLDDQNVLRLGGHIPVVEEKKEDLETLPAGQDPPIDSPTVTHPQTPQRHLPPAAVKEIPIILKDKGEAKLVLPINADDDDLRRVIKVLNAYLE